MHRYCKVKATVTLIDMEDNPTSVLDCDICRECKHLITYPCRQEIHFGLLFTVRFKYWHGVVLKTQVRGVYARLSCNQWLEYYVYYNCAKGLGEKDGKKLTNGLPHVPR